MAIEKEEQLSQRNQLKQLKIKLIGLENMGVDPADYDRYAEITSQKDHARDQITTLESGLSAEEIAQINEEVVREVNK